MRARDPRSVLDRSGAARAVLSACAALVLLAGCGSGSGADDTALTPSAGTSPDIELEDDADTGTTDQGDAEMAREDNLTLTVDDTVLTATLADNSSVDALIDLLADGPITVDMRDYGAMEKVGPLGTDLPRNDERIAAEPGDLILYQGNALVIYYAPNSWSFTRLGAIEGVTAQELKDALGPGDVAVTLSLGGDT